MTDRIEKAARAMCDALRAHDGSMVTEWRHLGDSGQGRYRAMAGAALATIEPEREALREALAWYADRENYVDGPSISKTVYAPYYPILDDRGQQARAALTKGGEGDD